MKCFKIYKEGVVTKKHIHELTEAQMLVEIGDWLNLNFETDNEDFDEWEKKADEKQNEIIEEAKSDDGFDMGDYIIYLRKEGCNYNNAEIILTTYNLRPAYSVYIDGEYKSDRYDSQNFDTIEEAMEVADLYCERRIDTFSMLLNKHHMNIKQISDRFKIPYRTVQNWSAGYRECPSYIIRMMDEILSN